MSKLHIVTVSTESKYYFPYLIESCKKNNIELTVLGFGEKWQGFNWRFNLMREYLVTLPQDDIVCFVDGYDVICLRDLNELKDNFINIKNRTNCKIIVGYDNIMNKIAKFFTLLYFTGEINAGTYIGTCKDILDILKNISDTDNSSDDQKLLNKYNNENKNIIYIDKEGELFGCRINGFNDSSMHKYYDIKNNNIYILNTNIQPFFIHGPGGQDFSIILDKLNYKHDKKIIDQIRKDTYKKIKRSLHFELLNFKKRIFHNRSKIFIVIIIIIIIIISIIIINYYKQLI